jgi:hypothetical protein
MRRVVVLLVLVLVAACSGDERSSRPSTTSTTSLALASVTARYVCGPTDGPWIDVEAEVSRVQRVYAELVAGGRVVGRSEPVSGGGASPTRLGFAPDLTADDFARGVGVVRLRRGSDGSLLAADELDLRLPEGMGCG